MALTNEVQYPEPSASGFLFANKASDGTITYTWQTGGASDKPETPTFSVAAGTYAQGQNVTITSATTDAVIYYTIDGSIPSTTATQYTDPVSIKNSCTLSAVAVVSGYTYSTVATVAYSIVRRIVTTAQDSSTYIAVALTSDDSGSTWSGLALHNSNTASRIASLYGTTVLSSNYLFAISTDRCTTFNTIPASTNNTYWPPTSIKDVHAVNGIFLGYVGYINSNGSYYACVAVSHSGNYFKFLSIPVPSQPSYSYGSSAHIANAAFYNGIYLIWLGNYMLKSTDNCASFTVLSNMPFAQGTDLKSTAYGFILGASSAVYTSTDGETWSQATITTYSNYNYIVCTLSTNVILIYSSSNTQVSYDGGHTFNKCFNVSGNEILDYAQSDVRTAEVGYLQNNVTVQQRQLMQPSTATPVTQSQNTGNRVTWNGDKFIIKAGAELERIGNDPSTSETLTTLSTYGSTHGLSISSDSSIALGTVSDTETNLIQDTQQTVPTPTVTKLAYTQTYLTDSGNDAFTTSFDTLNCGCYNPATGLLYVAPSSGNIKTINTATGVYSNLTTGGYKTYTGLLYCSTDGFLYGGINGGYIYKIDSTTGVETALTSVSRYWAYLTYNQTNSLLYGVCRTSSSSYGNTSLYSISLTGTETLITAASSYQSIQGISYDSNNVLIMNYDGSVLRVSTSDIITTVNTCIDHGTHYAATKPIVFNSQYIGIASNTLIGMAADGTVIYLPNPTNTTRSYKLLIVAGSSLYAIVNEYISGTTYPNRLRLLAVSTTSTNYVDATVTGDNNLFPILFGTTDGSDPTPSSQVLAANGSLTIQNATGTLQNFTYSYGTYGGDLSNITVAKLLAGNTLKVFAYIPNYTISTIVTTQL